jgi:hypothetical protein
MPTSRMRRSMGVIRTDVSEEIVASVLKVERIRELGER